MNRDNPSTMTMVKTLPGFYQRVTIAGRTVESRSRVYFLSDSEDALKGVTLSFCEWIAACFSGIQLVGTSFVDCDFSGSDFSDAYVSGLTFTRCDLSACKFPEDMSEIVLKNCRWDCGKPSIKFPE